MTSEHPLWVCGVYMYWYMFTNDPVARDVPQRAIIWLLGGAGPAEPIKCNKTIPFPLASVTAAWFPQSAASVKVFGMPKPDTLVYFLGTVLAENAH